MLSVVCFSHTLDNVGNHFKVPDLLSVGSLWIRPFKHSHRAKLIWQELTGRTPKSYSQTRLWSKWEVLEQLLVQFGDVEQFLQEAEAAKLAPQIVPQIRETLSDQESPINVHEFQLAAIVDVGHHFVTATYYLEGDGVLVFSCYEKLQGVAEACRVPHFPNVQKIQHRMSRHWNRGQEHALIQQFSCFYKSSTSSCMIWSLHSRLHESCAS